MDLSKLKDIKDLQELLDLMARYNLAELELSDGERAIRLRAPEAAPSREIVPVVATAPDSGPIPATPAPAPAPSAAAAAPAAPGGDALEEVGSPMVGTFYRAPSPEAEPFTVEGDRVEDDTVVCLIEAMKVMNEIPAGVTGIVPGDPRQERRVGGVRSATLSNRSRVKKLSRVLIANRGEIALRIIRACKELDIETVAVYSEADRDALHLRLADETICIGPGPSVQSYLDVPKIISAAEITDADAIHPGYGFLGREPPLCRSLPFLPHPVHRPECRSDSALGRQERRP